MDTKHIRVTTFTILRYVTSSVTWPFDSQVATSYRCCIVTKSLSPALFEILGPKHIGDTNLTFQGHVTSSVTWPFDSHVPISYRRSIVTKSLSPALFEILACRCIGVTTLTFRGHVTSSVTWPLMTSRDHLIPRYTFPIGTPLSPSLYLQPFPRYRALRILGSRPWPFRVTWRHRSRDHWTHDSPFPIGGPLDPSLYL